ncbi:MAG: AI-2E family transporter [Candidatus Latescibacteria bacterium]|nr:AI-2E family transporter [Candidatus Latescibacterota bacterium]
MNYKLLYRILIPASLGFLFLFAAIKIFSLLLPFLAAYVLYFILKPLVNLLEQRGFKHSFAVTIVFFSSFGLLTLFFFIFVPAIASEVSSIQSKLDVYMNVILGKINQIKTDIAFFSNGFSVLFSNEKNLASEIEGNLKKVLIEFISGIPSMLLNIIPLILYLFVIPFATFFFLLDEVKIKKKIIGFVPNRYFETTLLLFHNLNRQFGLLLRGMFTSAFIISFLASSGLWIIELDYPILVGIFAGLANLIPYFGPVAGTLAAFIVAVMTMKPMIFFVYILLVFIFVNLIDNIFVQPIVMARAANLHPLIVIFLVLLGSRLAGIFGMLLAVPIASLLQVILKIMFTEIYRPRKSEFSKYKIITTNPSHS